MFLSRFRFDSKQYYPGLQTLDRLQVAEKMQDCVGASEGKLRPLATFAFFLWDLFPGPDTIPHSGEDLNSDGQVTERHRLLTAGIQTIAREFCLRNESARTLLDIAVDKKNYLLAKALLKTEKHYIHQTAPSFATQPFSSALLSVETVGYTVLHLTALSGDTEMISTILNGCSDSGAAVFVNRRCSAALRTPLMLAAMAGHLDAVKLLADVPNVDLAEKDCRDMTALGHALEANHRDVAQWLMVHVAAESPYRPKTVASLLERAIDWRDRALFDRIFDDDRMEFRTGPSANILLYAIRRRAMDIAEKILESGRTDVNVKDRHGRTPVFEANSRREYSFIERLLRTGQVDLTCRDSYERTVSEHAAQNDQLDVVSRLIDGNFDRKNEDGRTLLSRAAEVNRTDVIEMLLARGVDVNARDNFGRTALWWTVRDPERRMDAARMLLEANGIDPNIEDQNGESPLAAAISTSIEEEDELLDFLRNRLEANDQVQRDPQSTLQLDQLNKTHLLLERGISLESLSEGFGAVEGRLSK